MFINKKPFFKNRGVHLDFKGLPPRFDRLLKIVDLCAELRVTHLLLEVEDMFPWQKYPMLKRDDSYTLEQMREFGGRCQENKITLVPLIQSFGHMENLLLRKPFVKYREHRDDPRAVCPLKDGVRDIIKRMIDEVAGVFPGIKHFHLGGDEAANFGQCPSCKRYVRRHGAASLYLKQTIPLLDYLENQCGIRPILWHDMMISWKQSELAFLARKADLMLWIYDQKTWVQNEWNRDVPTGEMISRFVKSGMTLWGAGAYRCGGEGIVPTFLKGLKISRHGVNNRGKSPCGDFSSPDGQGGIFCECLMGRLKTRFSRCVYVRKSCGMPIADLKRILKRREKLPANFWEQDFYPPWRNWMTC
ncbi:MAG: family 20 glycosylhydrolase [Verrucomicrobiae bacterium]|nr:family 20 glycosylhydrolase [Verrucomicrobiae bacterium]